MARRSLVRSGFALVSAVALFDPAVALAHGREPSIGAIAFDPADPDHIVVRATWALMTSNDHGETFTWACAPAVDFDRTIEDPPILVTPNGAVLAGTFDGLVASDPTGCDYETSLDPSIGDTFVIDLAPDPFDPAALWLLTSPGDRPNQVLHSVDQGSSFEARGTFETGLLLERIEPAPSDAMRVYTSGVVLRTPTTPRRAFVMRSSDGGASFERTEIPLIGVELPDYGERNAHVLGVDPTDRDVLYVRVTRRVTDRMPERLLRSDDGGETFTTVLELPEITGLAISEDGTTVWVGSWYGGFFRSDDRGLTFSDLDPALRVRCLGYRPGELWVCTDDIVGDYALGVSTDRGATIRPLWGFVNASPEVGCGVCTEVGGICPAYWPDVQFDLGLLLGVDAGMPPDVEPTRPVCVDGSLVAMDAGIDAGAMPEPSPAPASCGCRVGSGAPSSTIAVGVVVSLFVGARRRARGGRRSTAALR